MKSMGRTPGGSGCKEAKGGGGSATSEDSSVGESFPKAAAALKHIERRKELPIGSVASFVPREVITVLRRVGAPPASSQGSPIPLASDTVVPEEIDETVTAPPSHEDTLCHWERGKKELRLAYHVGSRTLGPFGLLC